MKQVSLREKKMALNNAVASVEMEGYKISDNEKELCMKVLDGKLTESCKPYMNTKPIITFWNKASMPNNTNYC